LTRDSFKAFDSCNLCLMRARDPVSCHEGDLFCRECAVENLLAQRKEIKRMQAELDRRIKEEEEQRMLEEEEAKERAVRDFELLQMGLEIRNRQNEGKNIVGMMPKVIGRENGKIMLEEEEAGNRTTEGKGVKRKFELDEEELMRLAREERKKAKAALSEEKVRRVAAYSDSPITDACSSPRTLHQSYHHSGCPA
jgi:nitric oxide synthase-interacting protein